jgi:hypothetical protein
MRKSLVFLTVAVLTAGMLAGCGGDDDSANPLDPGNESLDNGDSDSDDDPTDVTTGNDEYDALLKKAKTSSYRVTYKNDDGSEFTVSNDPPKSAFLDDSGSMYIRDGNDAISCSGVDSSDPSCIRMDDGGASVDALVQGYFGIAAAFLVADETTDNPLFDVTESDDEEIAGRDAKCAEIEAGALTGGDGRFKVCIDQETGVMLFSETETDGDTSRIEATDFGDPQDSDFEAPAEPQSLDDFTTQP